MTQEYGAAQPIADWVDSHIYKPAQRILGVVDKVPSTDQKRDDPSWHDDMVRKANQAFQKQAESTPKPVSKATPKYHKGTDYVPKTGPAILKKGEAVLNEKDADQYRATKGKDMSEKSHGSSRASHVLGGKGKSKSKSSKKHPHRLTISHGKSGGHKVVHSFAPDESGMTQPDEEHILPDKASLMQHIDENTPDVPAPQAAPPDASAAGASSAIAPQPPPGM